MLNPHLLLRTKWTIWNSRPNNCRFCMAREIEMLWPGPNTIGPRVLLSTNTAKASVSVWKIIQNPILAENHFPIAKSDIAAIEKGMRVISSQSCIKFRHTSNHRQPHLAIRRTTAGCRTTVGYRNEISYMSLGPPCITQRHIQHELLHALAFLHMHSDPKRNKFVTIAYRNIKKGYKHNFKRYRNSVDDFGFGYDFSSIMHYGPKSFSRNGKDTIIPRKRGFQLRLMQKMSHKDILKLRKVYCDDKSEELSEE